MRLKRFMSTAAQINRARTTSKDFIRLEDDFGCHNYHPLPVVIAKAKGVYLTDVEGKQYMDFLSAYSAVNQGHCHPRILDTFIQQAQTLTLTSRAVHNNQLGLIEKKLHDIFGYDKVLMMNTGVEAGESAIKFARRWGYVKKQIMPDRATVLFAKGNFWGRTIAACASSDDPDRYYNFGPFNGLNFELIDYNDIQALEKSLRANPNIVAFMVEPIQGEKGVIVPQEGYLKKAKQLLEAHNALLICDEIQTGLGRTGKMLCSDYDKVRPDMVLLGKALSGGFYPVSAVLCDKHIMDNIKPGEHGSTYGGNPLGSATALTALDVIIEEKLCENSNKMGQYLQTNLKRIMKGGKLKEVRGRGLFIGAQFQEGDDASRFSSILLKNGLVAKPTQKNIIRFAPPLVMTREQTDEAIFIIDKSWSEFEEKQFL